MFPLFTETGGPTNTPTATAPEPDANDADGFAALLAATWFAGDTVSINATPAQPPATYEIKGATQAATAAPSLEAATALPPSGFDEIPAPAPPPPDADAIPAPAPPPVFDTASNDPAGNTPPPLTQTPPVTFNEDADEISRPAPPPVIDVNADGPGTTPPPVTYTPPPSDADAAAATRRARPRASGPSVEVENRAAVETKNVAANKVKKGSGVEIKNDSRVDVISSSRMELKNGSRVEIVNGSGVEAASGSSVEIRNGSGVGMRNGLSVEVEDAGAGRERSNRATRQALFELSHVQRVNGARPMPTISALRPLLFERASADAEGGASGVGAEKGAPAQNVFAGLEAAGRAQASAVSQSASERVAEAATTNENIDAAATHIIESAEALAPQKERAVRLRLRPEELGAVELVVARDSEGRVSARLTVETDAALQAMNEGLDSLRATLERAGVNVDRLDVYAGANSHRHQATGERRRDDGNEPRRLGASETAPGDGAVAVNRSRAARERLLSVRA